jgi:DNA-binding NarL/FixJ family response regulator
VSKYVVSDYVRRLNQDQTPLDQITPRQREILQLIAEGKSTKDIAELLYISTKTVETHRTQLMDRLDIHDIAGLVRYAIRIGLVVLE